MRLKDDKVVGVEEGKDTCLLKAQCQRDMRKRTKELQGSSTWKERARAQPEQDRWEYNGPMEGPEKYHGDIRVWREEMRPDKGMD